MTYGTMIPVKNRNILEKDLGDEIVIMSEKGQEIHTLDGTACFIWKLIDGTRSLGSISERMTEEYDTTSATARADIEVFLESLRELRLISLH